MPPSTPVFRLLCSLLLCVASGLACAQQTGNPDAVFGFRVASWTQLLDNVQRGLQDRSLDDDALADAHERIQDLLTAVAKLGTQTRAEEQRIGLLLDTLGPPPDADAAQEAPAVAADRTRLRDLLTQAEARNKQAQLMAARAQQLVANISETRRRLLTDALLERGPSSLRPELLTKAGSDLAGIVEQVVTAPFDVWFLQPPEDQLARARERGLIIVAGWALLLYFGARLRRSLLGRYVRNRDVTEPSYSERVKAALAALAARGGVPVVVAGLPLLLGFADMRWHGLFANTLMGALAGALLATAVYAIGRAVLAPYSPAVWRLLPLPDDSARKLFRRTVALAGVLGVAFFLEYTTARQFEVSQELAIVFNFVVDTTVAVYLMLLAQPDLWRDAEADPPAPSTTPENDPQAEANTEDAPSAFSFWSIVRALVLFSAPVIPVAAVLGYNALSSYLASNIAFSVMLLGVLVLVHRLVGDVAALALAGGDVATPNVDESLRDRGGRLLHFWLMAAFNIVLVAAASLLVLSLWGVAWQDLEDVLQQAVHGIRIGSFTLNVADLLLAILLFVAILLVTRSLQRVLEKSVFPRTRLDIGVRNSLKTATGYAGLVLAGGIAVSTLGLDLSEFAIVLGALSVGIGFGLQAIVNNFVSGLILLIERPVKVGDWVVIGVHQGYVKRISVRATELETFQRASVIIPNSELISASLVNWTHKDTYARVEVAMGVEHDTDVTRLRDTLLTCARAHSRVVGWPQPQVVFMRFGADSLDFELRVFIAQADYMIVVASELRFAILEALRGQGIRIAHPQMNVHWSRKATARPANTEDGTES